jgi:hypothetical protein
MIEEVREGKFARKSRIVVGDNGTRWLSRLAESSDPTNEGKTAEWAWRGTCIRTDIIVRFSRLHGIICGMI